MKTLVRIALLSPIPLAQRMAWKIKSGSKGVEEGSR